MGQRHQIYVGEKKNGKYRAISAHHHQWKYGLPVVYALTRLVKLIEGAVSDKDDFNYSFRDHRELNTVVTAAYGIGIDGYVSMVHNESTEGYLINEERTKFQPCNGDNNEGCSIVLIDRDKKEVRACFFSFHGIEGRHTKGLKNWTAYDRKKWLSFYHTDKELNEDKEDAELVKSILDQKVKLLSTAELLKITSKK